MNQTHLEEVLQPHAPAVGLLQDALCLGQGLLQGLPLPGHHQAADLPEEGLCQDHVGF